MFKIKKQLKEFKAFKENYKFTFKELKEKNGEVYCGKDLVQDKDGNITPCTDTFINVGYKLKGALPKALSNLFPYEFWFKGKKVKSIESIFQGIKFKDKKSQNLVLKYDGLNSNHIKIATTYRWEETGYIYWQGKAIKRDSVEYDAFIDELYISAVQNPLYKGVLLNTGNLYIMHSIGETEKTKTVFTRYEFEKQLNCLKDFVIRKG